MVTDVNKFIENIMSNFHGNEKNCEKKNSIRDARTREA